MESMIGLNRSPDSMINSRPKSFRSSTVNRRRGMSFRIKRSKDVKIDPLLVDNFEDWLEADARFGPQCFQLKLYKESGMTKLLLEALKESPGDCDIIPKLIKNDSNLLRLSFVNSKLSPDTCHVVLKALVYNKTIRSITFGFSGINHLASTSIKEVLTYNNTLTSIDLKNNQIGDSGFTAIMNALETNDSLTDLDLRRNNITGEACHAMKKTLMTNQTLQKLDLRGNSVGDDGCRLIIDGLYNNTSLATLKLERNNIDKDILRKCSLLIARNHIIKSHRNNDINDDGISFYISMENKDHKPYLTWARGDISNAIVDETTKSSGSLSLIVFIDTLRSIIDPVNDNAALSDSSLFDSVSPSIEHMLRDRKQISKLGNQKINKDTYILHMVAISEHCTSLKYHKFLSQLM